MGLVEIGVSGILGLVIGILGTVAVGKVADKPVPTENHAGTEQAIAQLTELDLTKPICDPAYIEKHGNLLCRELTCLQFTRGLDAQTSGAQCESISNIGNKIQIDSWCREHAKPEQYQDCVDLFWKRN